MLRHHALAFVPETSPVVSATMRIWFEFPEITRFARTGRADILYTPIFFANEGIAGHLCLDEGLQQRYQDRSQLDCQVKLIGKASLGFLSVAGRPVSAVDTRYAMPSIGFRPIYTLTILELDRAVEFASSDDSKAPLSFSLPSSTLDELQQIASSLKVITADTHSNVQLFREVSPALIVSVQYSLVGRVFHAGEKITETEQEIRIFVSLAPNQVPIFTPVMIAQNPMCQKVTTQIVSLDRGRDKPGSARRRDSLPFIRRLSRSSSSTSTLDNGYLVVEIETPTPFIFQRQEDAAAARVRISLTYHSGTSSEGDEEQPPPRMTASVTSLMKTLTSLTLEPLLPEDRQPDDDGNLQDDFFHLRAKILPVRKYKLDFSKWEKSAVTPAAIAQAQAQRTAEVEQSRQQSNTNRRRQSLVDTAVGPSMGVLADAAGSTYGTRPQVRPTQHFRRTSQSLAPPTGLAASNGRVISTTSGEGNDILGQPSSEFQALENTVNSRGSAGLMTDAFRVQESDELPESSHVAVSALSSSPHGGEDVLGSTSRRSMHDDYSRLQESSETAVAVNESQPEGDIDHAIFEGATLAPTSTRIENATTEGTAASHSADFMARLRNATARLEASQGPTLSPVNTQNSSSVASVASNGGQTADSSIAASVSTLSATQAAAPLPPTSRLASTSTSETRPFETATSSPKRWRSIADLWLTHPRTASLTPSFTTPYLSHLHSLQLTLTLSPTANSKSSSSGLLKTLTSSTGKLKAMELNVPAQVRYDIGAVPSYEVDNSLPEYDHSLPVYDDAVGLNPGTAIVEDQQPPPDESASRNQIEDGETSAPLPSSSTTPVVDRTTSGDEDNTAAATARGHAHAWRYTNTNTVPSISSNDRAADGITTNDDDDDVFDMLMRRRVNTRAVNEVRRVYGGDNVDNNNDDNDDNNDNDGDDENANESGRQQSSTRPNDETTPTTNATTTTTTAQPY